MPRLLSVTLFAVLGACAARPAPASMTRADQTQAMHMFCEGASITEVASHFSLGTNEARALIHGQLVDLNKRYYGNSSRR